MHPVRSSLGMKLQVALVLVAALLFLSPQVEASCTKTYKVVSGDSCWSIWTSHNLTQQQFTALNPTLHCKPLPVGVVVCLAAISSTAGCASYYQVKNNDYCESIASKVGESTSKLMADNPGVNCDDLQTGYVFCVGYGHGSLPRLPFPHQSCSVPGTFAITFDDGPYLYTDALLDYLKAHNLKATFFVNGNNYGYIYDYNATLKRMVAEGHQIGHHTWSHPDITTLSPTKLTEEMLSLEAAFRNIIGKVPRYFRPPYGNVDLTALNLLYQRGYEVVVWDVDNNDSLTSKPTTLKQDQASFKSTLKAAGINPKKDGHISLGHDPHPVTAQQYAPWVYNYVQGLGYKTVTVAECLGVTNPDDWYRP